MEIETRETDKGVEIRIHVDRKVAVAVKSASGERIYLPYNGVEQNSYYAESSRGLARSDGYYTVHHPEEIYDVEVIG